MDDGLLEESNVSLDVGGESLPLSTGREDLQEVPRYLLEGVLSLRDSHSQVPLAASSNWRKC